RLESFVGTLEFRVFVPQPAKLFGLAGGRPVIPLATIGFILTDPVPQRLGMHAQLFSQNAESQAWDSTPDTDAPRVHAARRGTSSVLPQMTPFRPIGPCLEASELTREPHARLARAPHGITARASPCLGRSRLRRPSDRPRHQNHPRPDGGDRLPPTRPERLPSPAPTLGHRTHPRLDQPTPTLRPRLRTPPPTPRHHGPLGRHHPHDPPPRTPTTTPTTRSKTASIAAPSAHGPRPAETPPGRAISAGCGPSGGAPAPPATAPSGRRARRTGG
ncbi:hypothetical protein SAMN05216215_106449, partial [Saccharopolyspora shandongensis]